MRKLIKPYLSMVVGIIILGIPGLLKKEIYLINVICSVVSTVLFSIPICFDRNWELKEEFRLNNKEKLEKIQSILFLCVLLLLTLIGYLFKIEGLILFYAHKNGFGIGIVPILASLIVEGVVTLLYKIRLREKDGTRY